MTGDMEGRKDMEGMDGLEDRIILLDENGNDVEFEYVDTVDRDGMEYVVLSPLDEGKGDGSTDEEVVILRIEHNSDGEDSFVTIDDEEEEEGVFQEFLAKIEEEDGCED